MSACVRDSKKHKWCYVAAIDWKRRVTKWDQRVDIWWGLMDYDQRAQDVSKETQAHTDCQLGNPRSLPTPLLTCSINIDVRVVIEVWISSSEALPFSILNCSSISIPIVTLIFKCNSVFYNLLLIVDLTYLFC